MIKSKNISRATSSIFLIKECKGVFSILHQFSVETEKEKGKCSFSALCELVHLVLHNIQAWCLAKAPQAARL